MLAMIRLSSGIAGTVVVGIGGTVGNCRVAVGADIEGVGTINVGVRVEIAMLGFEQPERGLMSTSIATIIDSQPALQMNLMKPHFRRTWTPYKQIHRSATNSSAIAVNAVGRCWQRFW
jgi:hypothetical protein